MRPKNKQAEIKSKPNKYTATSIDNKEAEKLNQTTLRADLLESKITKKK